jgi:hypothetical protein
MMLENQILTLVHGSLGITELELGQALFPIDRQAQHVNSACRRLVLDGMIYRRAPVEGAGPFRYYPRATAEA